MCSSNASKQLGIPFGTASHRLKKLILFDLVCKLGVDNCYRCKLPIDKPEDLTVEHKIEWLYRSNELFWDLNNIAFSHKKCNKPRPEFRIGRKATIYPEGFLKCGSCKILLELNSFTKSGQRLKECKTCKSRRNKERIRRISSI